MALRQGTPGSRDGTPQLRVVSAAPRPASNAALGEEFLFTGGTLETTVSRKRRSSPRALVRFLIVLVLVVAVGIAVKTLTAPKPVATPLQPVAKTTAAAAPAAAPAAGVPISVVASTLDPVSSSGVYRAVVTIRNANDVAADNVTVNVTLRDASGAVVTRESRSIGSLGSGQTMDVAFGGELDPSAAPPTGIDVSAAAAQLEAHD
jgi:hypothetical protein